MSQLDRYIERYGKAAGPKLYHAVRSRSAHMGVNARRRAAIARLNAAVIQPRKVVGSGSERTLLLPFDQE